MSQSCRLDIVIVNYNSADLVDQCMQSIERETFTAHRVTVLDNASTNGCVESLEAKYPLVTFIKNAKNVGFSTANNQALKKGTGEYAVLLNPDTILTENALDKMVGYLECHPNVAMAGAEILNADGTVCALETWYPTPWRYVIGPLLKRFQREPAGPVEYASGACLMVRRSCIDRIGLLDENIFMFAEDVDWCYRARAHGYSVHVVQGAQVLHVGGASATKDFAARVFNGRQGKLYFAKKHYGLGTYSCFKITIAVEALLKLLVDSVAYLFRNGHKRWFYSARMRGYWRLLRALPFSPEFRIPER